MRRPRVPWMTQGDDRILEFLLNEGGQELYATPRVISYNINYARNYVQERIKILRDADLVAYEDEKKAMYRITDRGRAYLSGELDVDDFDIDVGS